MKSYLSFKKNRPRVKMFGAAYTLNYTTANATPVYTVSPGHQAGPAVYETIDSFSALPHGWDFGRGGPIPEETLSLARSWVDYLYLQGFSHIDAFPGGSGEVALGSSNGDHYFELIVEPNGTSLSLAYDHKRKQVFYASHLNAKEVVSRLAGIKGAIWSASESYTPINIMSGKESLLDLRSKIREQMELYRSSTITAFQGTG